MSASRVSLLVNAAVLALLLAVQAANAEVRNAGVVHTVFLWLHQPDNLQHRQALLLATERLRSIPGVDDIRFGTAISSDRAIVDDSFDIGIYFYFSDVDAMNRYLVHPLHLEVVEKVIKPRVQRIVVYDFSDTRVR